MRILVTDGMDKTAMAQLREAGHEVVEQFYAPEELGAALREFDAVVVRSKTKVRANHIDEAKGGKLKLIIRGGVGVDNIDVKYAEANGITVKNTPKASSQSVAELAMGHMFSCARYLSIAGHTMREGKWEKKAYGKGIELQRQDPRHRRLRPHRPASGRHGQGYRHDCHRLRYLPHPRHRRAAGHSRMSRWTNCLPSPTSSPSMPRQLTAAH